MSERLVARVPAATSPDAETASPVAQVSVRLTSLDGLRGLAAMAVLLFHVLYLSQDYFGVFDASGPSVTGRSWWLARTPLHMLWAGHEAVYLFFVLSGLVLALPAVRGQILWVAYYPQRLLRLYLPVWGSLVLSVPVVVLVSRQHNPELSAWFNSSVPSPGLHGVLQDTVLVFGAGYVNSPLWSLRWEVLFSLLLPLYLLGGRMAPRSLLIKTALLLVAIGTARALWIGSAFFLLMFALGVVLAFHLSSMHRAATWVSRGGRFAWGGLGLLFVLLFTSRTMALGAGPLDDVQRGVLRGMQMGGVVLLVFLALHWPWLRALLQRPAVQWLGVRSFSLYLVHEPVVITIGVLVPGVGVLGWLVLGVPASLLLAHVFYRVVEAPAHRLSQCVGRSIRTRHVARVDARASHAQGSTPSPGGSRTARPAPPRCPSGPPAGD
jgi:peptidoglycan/LPS O-acetylase OafA/YrhL